MRPVPFVLAASLLVSVGAVVTVVGCEKERPASAGGTPKDAHDHDHAHDDHDHDHDHDDGTGHEHSPSDDGHGEAAFALGEMAIGAFTVHASREAGQVLPGKESAIDVSVTAAAGATVKVVAVRMWIGTEDAKGSVKSKGEIEDAGSAQRWHAHVETPNPLPEGSRLWIEIEDDQGGTSVGGFDLKA